MKKSILHVPNQDLRIVSTPVVWDTKMQQFSKDLSETLLLQNRPKGVGLSAPQIGKNWRVFVTLMNEDESQDATPKDLEVYINPVITETSTEQTFGPDIEDPILEGCLSIPKLYGPVPRFEWISIQYQRPGKNGLETIEKKTSGFLARVIQHEYDHLEGILFTDYALKHDLPVYEFVGKRMEEIDKRLIEAF